jgi:hypothetical protein
MITLDQALDSAMQLPFYEKELLIEILRKRAVEERRKETALEVKEAQASYDAGKLQSASTEQILNELYMQTIQLPLNEYKALKEELLLLKDSDFIKKINKLIDLLYQEKYGLFLGNFTEDLAEASINNLLDDNSVAWDNV